MDWRTMADAFLDEWNEAAVERKQRITLPLAKYALFC